MTNAIPATVNQLVEKYTKDATGKCYQNCIVLASCSALSTDTTLCFAGRITFQGMHHVALLCNSLERSLEFYQGVLGEFD